MVKVNLLGYPLKFVSYQDILELIKKGTSQNRDFYQILSLNPENLLLLSQNQEYKKLVLSSQTLIPDGVGIIWAAKLLAGISLTRLPGVELMDRLIGYANEHRLRCLLIGGNANLAENTAECYSKRYPKLKIRGLRGVVNIKQPNTQEILALKQIVSLMRPHLVFIAFGSPAQELFIEEYKQLFGNSLVMGVGGGFAMMAGVLPRAPKIWQRLNLEWLYRLFQQPWRIYRQIKLIKFVILVLKAKWRL